MLTEIMHCRNQPFAPIEVPIHYTFSDHPEIVFTPVEREQNFNLQLQRWIDRQLSLKKPRFEIQKRMWLIFFNSPTSPFRDPILASMRVTVPKLKMVQRLLHKYSIEKKLLLPWKNLSGKPQILKKGGGISLLLKQRLQTPEL